MSQPNREAAVLDELASHGILTWQPTDAAHVQVRLRAISDRECERIYPLLSQAARIVWKTLSRMFCERQGYQFEEAEEPPTPGEAA